ncbi:histone-lysine N-methyltransferase SUVR4 isoform X3 [Mercurialis annua]|uniref:histone-lysine N-methyltransferase SUVR4 isoform X3 n=1 Tax=Mercurialis annua TaxID=3986 RepID=UPI0021605DCC|nr:histone-lysine N-methyltransferase SUVR4 isoform X3 [Mercurialis annua]
MAPNPKIMNAFRAMKNLGIPQDKVKPVLKKLLKLYDNNWLYVEEENYRALADAIFEADDDQSKGGNIEEEAEVHDEPEQPLKRQRLRSEEGQACAVSDDSNSMSGGPLMKKPKVEGEAARGANALQRSPDMRKPQPGDLSPQNRNSESSQMRNSYKGKEPMLLQAASKEKRPIVERPSLAVQIRDPVGDRGKQKMRESNALIKPKDEPFTDELPPDNLPCYEAPIAVIRPDSSSVRSITTGKPNDHVPLASHFSEENGGDTLPVSSSERRTNSELAAATQDKSSSDLEIASSTLGEESVMNVTTTVDVLKKPAACIALGNGLVDMCSLTEESAERITRPLQPIIEDTQASANGSVEIDRGDELEDPESHSLVVVPQNQLTSSEIRSLHDISDIAKGEEFVEIPWLNEINKECPPSFNYISQNLIFQNAHVKFTLSQIKAENCCSTCIGDCLSSTTVCACASENGDKFAYNSQGLLTEEFLEDCISITRDPQRQCLSYCKACPLERSKNEEILEPCKGHVKRNYIKECWSKCACHKLCGNRVVQRGIMCQLQVFFTPEGKGWGLRTLDKLPKGTFVCEYVGEILTGKELQERKMQRTRGTNVNRHTCSVLLDAYWCLKGAVKDEETLCLDASFFGNVARFINHRCLDSNLIEIPVKMDTPDHHYYHLAFFTTRDVDAMEELTWDYGIDFDDNDHPVEMFRCLCGSKFCRNMKRSNRSKHLLR